MIGTVVGSLVSRIGPLRRAFGSLLTGLQTMPSVAWIPFAIIGFGSSTSLPTFVAGLKQAWAFTAVMIVILALGAVVDGLFGLANRGIRTRWGIDR